MAFMKERVSEIPAANATQMPIEGDLPKIDITDTAQVRKLLSDELWLIVKRNRGSLAAVPAIKELWDRTEGKPGQAVTIDATLKQITVNANIEFIQSARDNLIIDAVSNSEVIDNKG